MTKKSWYHALGTTSNFLALPKSSSSLESSQIVVLPAPYEHTVSYGRGTRRGPHAIIAASQFVEFYDEELDRELCNQVGIATLPPIHFGKRAHLKAINLVKERVSDLLAKGKFVVTLGGEHTISAGTIAAHLERYPDLSVLQIDAHSDLRDVYQGTRYSHACVMARVAEMMDPSKIVQVGIRAQCIEESRFIREKGIRTFYVHKIRTNGKLHHWQQQVLDPLTGHVYVTFDVDGFDPSIMPSTGTPEPNGLFWAETMQLLRLIGEQKSIIGFDVVELAPAKGLTFADLSAAKLTYKLMNYAFLRSKKDTP
jgi:agmatinase